MTRHMTASIEINYDRLLPIFLSKDDLRPAMQQANSVGGNTYVTDGHSLIIVPNELLKSRYDPHPKTPDYQSVLSQILKCPSIKFKDIDLFKALEAQPKVHDTSECEECEGSGQCPHCHRECEVCDGEGQVEDKYLPMVYSSRATIQIGEQYFRPSQVGKLEKVLLDTGVETFELTGRSKVAALFKVGPVEILFGIVHEDHSDWPNVILKPIQ